MQHRRKLVEAEQLYQQALVLYKLTQNLKRRG